MKTFFILLFALFVTPLGWSAPFGFLPGAENIDNPSAPSALLRKIVSGEPVCVAVQSFRSNETRTEEEYLEMLRQSYQEWFDFTLKTVRQAGREDEFKDLLPALQTQVVVRKDCPQPDINFFVIPANQMKTVCKASSALACVDVASRPYKMYFSPKKGLANWAQGGNDKLLSHELGHTLGFADQYPYGRINSSMAYHTPDSSKGIMSVAKAGIKFSCDEADGFINLLDVGVYGKARGGKDGWRSFCPKRTYRYVQGRPTSNDKYAVEVIPPNVVVMTFGKEGMLQNTQYFPDAKDYSFDIQTVFTPEETDKSGRFLYGKSDKGEEMYCSYMYERKRCVATKEAANVALWEDYFPHKKVHIVTLAYSSPKGKSIWLNYFEGKDEKILVYKGPDGIFEFGFSSGMFVIKGRQVFGKKSEPEKEPASPQEALLQRKAQQAAERAQQERVEKLLLTFYDRYVEGNMPVAGE